VKRKQGSPKKSVCVAYFGHSSKSLSRNVKWKGKGKGGRRKREERMKMKEETSGQRSMEKRKEHKTSPLDLNIGS